MAYEGEYEQRDRPLRERVNQLADETTTRMRRDVRLTKAELAASGWLTQGGAFFGAAAVSALGAVGALTAFLILALDGAIPSWAAALVVGVALGGIAGGLALMGHDRMHEATARARAEAIEKREHSETGKVGERAADGGQVDA
jgi:hypothetical protein